MTDECRRRCDGCFRGRGVDAEIVQTDPASSIAWTEEHGVIGTGWNRRLMSSAVAAGQLRTSNPSA